jgi:DHA1 family multidrug resistance protein-like MFS transporter
MRLLFFGVGALATVTALLCAFVLHEPARVGEEGAAVTGRGVRQRDLLADRATLAMLVLLVLFQVMIMASWPSLALFVEKIGVPRDSVATTTGLVIFVAGVPAMFISTAWARLGNRFGVETMMLTSLILSGISYAAVGVFVGRVETLLVLRLISGVSLAGFVPLSFHWMGMRAPDSARGRMAGLASTAMMIGNVIGPLLGGWLAVHVDLAATFYVPGTGLALIGIAFAAVSASRGA